MSWSDVELLIAGVVAIAALWALVQSYSANRKADDANRIASESNKIAERSAKAAEKSSLGAERAVEIANRNYSLEEHRFQRENAVELRLVNGPSSNVSGLSYFLTLKNLGPKAARDVRFRQVVTLGFGHPDIDHEEVFEIVGSGEERTVKLRGEPYHGSLYFMVIANYEDTKNHELRAYGIMPIDIKELASMPTGGVLVGQYLDSIPLKMLATDEDETTRMSKLAFIERLFQTD